MNFEDYKKFHNYKRDNCPVCSSENKAEWARHDFFQADQCEECGFVFINPSLDEDGLNYYYSNYIGDRLKNLKKMEERLIQYKIDADFIERFVDHGSLLDVGCNGGFFLDALSKNFNKFGIEIDSDAVTYAKQNYDFNIENCNIGEDSFSENTFDVISFRGVIEHMLEPKHALKRAGELLKPGGYIYFCATPNLKCLSAELYKEKWNLWHPIEHINIFDKDTLQTALGKNFSLTAHEYQYLGTPYENIALDHEAIQRDIELKSEGRWDEVIRSKPFWGNMMSVIFQKNI